MNNKNFLFKSGAQMSINMYSYIAEYAWVHCELSNFHWLARFSTKVRQTHDKSQKLKCLI